MSIWIRIRKKLPAMVLFAIFILLWQALCSFGILPSYMLPSPVSVAKAFARELPLLAMSSVTTLKEAVVGLVLSLVVGIISAILMDNNRTIENAISPLLYLTQTVPTIAIAPLLILWFGYGILPKVILVFITCVFPIIVAFLSGLQQADKDTITMIKTMGATRLQVYRHIKIPTALPELFSGIKISAGYSIISAVVAEWLGGNEGLGVYMTRVRKSYAYDKMFASIIVISMLSIIMIKFFEYLEKKLTPWNN